MRYYIRITETYETFIIDFRLGNVYSLNSAMHYDISYINPALILAVRANEIKFTNWTDDTSLSIEYYTDRNFTDRIYFDAPPTIESCTCSAHQLLFGNPDCKLHDKVKEDIYY